MITSFFPTEQHETQGGDRNHICGHGMTLRDYFAAKAMANMGPINSDQDLKHMPAWAYKIADAMLAASNNHPKE